jgi:hypothetical protein
VREQGLYDELMGIDIKIHNESRTYCEVIEFIKNDKLFLDTLVISYKIDLLNTA